MEVCPFGIKLYMFSLFLGRVIDWSIDFLKTASGASQVYEVDYTSALLDEGAKQPDKVLEIIIVSCLVYVIKM